jgi:hypothetical protein
MLRRGDRVATEKQHPVDVDGGATGHNEAPLGAAVAGDADDCLVVDLRRGCWSCHGRGHRLDRFDGRCHWRHRRGARRKEHDLVAVGARPLSALATDGARVLIDQTGRKNAGGQTDEAVGIVVRHHIPFSLVPQPEC